MTTLQDIADARQNIEAHLHRTPITHSRSLSERTGTDLFFKLEMFQKTGSFKIRGVLNKLHHLSAAEKERGVIGVSSGNHAQALAFGATLAGVQSTIVMPSWSLTGKVEATRGYGGEVILTDDNLLETCLRIQKERGLTMVHPFDDPHIIAGAATLGSEILEEVPEPDAVLVSIGGGGLISGVSAAIKLQSPSTRVIGIEPSGAAVMSQSLAAGKPTTLEKVETIADGLAAPFTGPHTLEHVQQFVDEIVLVSDEEILEAMRLLIDRCKVVPEPAAAAAFVPLLNGKLDLPENATVVCILCGGNIDSRRLKELL